MSSLCIPMPDTDDPTLKQWVDYTQRDTLALTDLNHHFDIPSILFEHTVKAHPATEQLTRLIGLSDFLCARKVSVLLGVVSPNMGQPIRHAAMVRHRLQAGTSGADIFTTAGFPMNDDLTLCRRKIYGRGWERMVDTDSCHFRVQSLAPDKQAVFDAQAWRAVQAQLGGVEAVACWAQVQVRQEGQLQGKMLEISPWLASLAPAALGQVMDDIETNQASEAFKTYLVKSGIAVRPLKIGYWITPAGPALQSARQAAQLQNDVVHARPTMASARL